MLKRTWLLIAIVYFGLAEALSWMPVSDLSLCLIQAEHSQQSANHDGEKYCSTFHAGAALVFEKVDSFLEHHDKSVVGGFTIVLAISTIGLWLATNRLWQAGETQRLLAENTAERELRAYISVETGVYFRQDKSTRFEFQPVIVNNGATPAKNVRIQTNLGLVPVGIPENFDYYLGPGISGPQTSISDIGPRRNKFNSTDFHRRATVRELRGILKKTHYFHTYGRVSYEDVFGNERYTNYSFVISIPAKRGLNAIWMATERNNNAT